MGINFGGFSDIDSAGLIIDLLDGPKRITSTTKTQGITLSDFAVLGWKAVAIDDIPAEGTHSISEI